MTHPEQRRRQILDDETGEAQRFDTSRSGAPSALRNNRVQEDIRLQEDRRVTGVVGRLRAFIRQALIRQGLIRNVRGGRKK
jgi:hypothetical protein